MSRFTDRQLALILQKQGHTVVVPAARKKRDNEESRMQQSLCSWWVMKCREYGVPEILLYAVPMGGRRDARTGAIMKREGARAGAPDLVLDVPRGQFHGLRIELKKEDGVVSDEQRAFLKALVEQGYACRVCYSVRSAIQTVDDYLKGEL